MKKDSATKLKASIASHKNQTRGLLEYLMLDCNVVSKETVHAAGVADPNRIITFIRQAGWNVETVNYRPDQDAGKSFSLSGKSQNETFYCFKRGANNC